MAQRPYKFVRRGLLYVPSVSGFTKGARASQQREQTPNYSIDSGGLLNATDRTRLMAIGRDLAHNCSPVRGTLNEIAKLAAAVVIPQFEGADRAWGEAAELYLYDSGKFLDVRGWPFDTDAFNRILVLSVLRDGEEFVLLTEDENGDPKIQVIPAHRVGSRTEKEVKKGVFAGYRIQDGVILDEYGRAIGYRVLGDTASEDRDYSSDDLFPIFDPDFADQSRGFSALGASVIDWQDYQETRRFELMAQKKLASVAVLESNELGEMPPSNTVGIPGIGIADDGSDERPAIFGEEMLGGETRYFRAGSGSKWEIPPSDRPSANQQAFSADIVRQAIHGIGWSSDFSLDPTKAGGASMRTVIEKCNRQLDHLRERILSPVRKRIDAWRIAKAIKNGRLAPNEDWWRWSYQFAARLTADEKYSSDVDLQEMHAGVSSFQKVCAKRGDWWQEVIDQKIAEERYIQQRAAEAGIDPNAIRLLTPNGNSSQAPTPTDQNQ
jgi:hypothetical protein